MIAICESLLMLKLSLLNYITVCIRNYMHVTFNSAVRNHFRTTKSSLSTGITFLIIIIYIKI